MVMTAISRKGSPLVTFVLLAGVWVSARAMMWEGPPAPQAAAGSGKEMMPAYGMMPAPSAQPAGRMMKMPRYARGVAGGGAGGGAGGSAHGRSAMFGREKRRTVPAAPFANGAVVRVPLGEDVVRVSLGRGAREYPPQRLWAAASGEDAAQSSMGHAVLWREAMLQSGRERLENAGFRNAAIARAAQAGASPTGPEAPRVNSKVDRFFLDTWGFYRQGSSAAPISQGRVPTYGASQAGAKLAYRLAPRSGHDPRLYARAYRAMTQNGESELALGASGRVLSKFPVRLAGEVRATQTPAGLRFRPAGYVFTEIPPVSLPARFSLEAYGQAGYVGGRDATAFADGQATATRPLTNFSAGKFGNARVSFGGGIWGGAQKGAHRLDIGPTVRVDMTIGKVPARFSVDWRHKVAGDAAPQSGVAATLSTRF